MLVPFTPVQYPVAYRIAGNKKKEHRMQYANLGRSGLKVSRLCLGCMSYGEPERLPQPWSLDEKASRPLIRQALEAGINFI